MIRHIAVRFFAPVINFAVDCINIVIRRDKRIILCGAWMGEKFADNARYLFQFLDSEKINYGIKDIVWVTRNKSLYEELLGKGYKVYMMHSAKSIYYHLKAGVHIICNLSFPANNFKSDIIGQLSGRAIKLNTWHGIPIKAGKSTGDNAKTGGVFSKLRYYFKKSEALKKIFSPGHWDEAYYFSTSKECTRRSSAFCGVSEEKFIECGYPRDCDFSFTTDRERKIIDLIKNSNASILYVPTFRSNGSMPHPLEDQEFRNFIINNDVLWVEKPHSAILIKSNIEAENNVLFLDSSFDINVILPYFYMIVTDYSSVYYDAVAFNRPTVFYSPDFENYKRNDRGFLCDYKQLVGQYNASNTSELISIINKMIHDEEFYNSAVDKILSEKEEMFDKQKWSLKEICDYLFDEIINNSRK